MKLDEQQLGVVQVTVELTEVVEDVDKLRRVLAADAVASVGRHIGIDGLALKPKLFAQLRSPILVEKDRVTRVALHHRPATCDLVHHIRLEHFLAHVVAREQRIVARKVEVLDSADFVLLSRRELTHQFERRAVPGVEHDLTFTLDIGPRHTGVRDEVLCALHHLSSLPLSTYKLKTCDIHAIARAKRLDLCLDAVAHPHAHAQVGIGGVGAELLGNAEDVAREVHAVARLKVDQPVVDRLVVVRVVVHVALVLGLRWGRMLLGEHHPPVV